MPPRRKKTKRRRRFTGINVLDAAQAYTQLAIWSKATTGLNPIEFLTGSSGGSTNNITLRELLGMGSAGGYGVYGPTAQGRGLSSNATAMDIIGANFKDNWLDAAIMSTGAGIGFTLAKKLTKSPRRMANKAIKQLGLGSMVRV
tara:strand:+ start:1352 stop:1783 length:432 start_codon:yes stop_codon:yes gene_type:complete